MDTAATVPPPRTDSRTAILEAAAAEFAERGFVGARMEHIAARAGYNKALVYRHFGDRETLVREVLRQHLARRTAVHEALPTDLGEALVTWFRVTAAGEARDFVRLLGREALNDDGSPAVEAEARREYYGRQIERLRQMQATGAVTADLPASPLFLALMALIAFPASYPQLVRLVTGQELDEPEFQRDWEALLRALAVRLAPTD